VHGVVRAADDDDASITPFNAAALLDLRARQVRALEHVDTITARLFDKLPPNTWLMVMSDHGELFGEDGYFGHGPIQHDKVFEVPFVEGLHPDHR
jgi:arylsulfatase A-like enzyme